MTHRLPPYHPPYMYPPIYDPYFRTDRHSHEKEKKNDAKDINYPPMPFAWPYPPFTSPPLQPSENTTVSKQSTINSNSNINYEFPMHMYPPYGSGRYPPPYMDYSYQPNRENFTNQFHNAHQNSNLPATKQHHAPSQAYPATEGPSFRCLPPYPPYPHHGYFPHHEAAVANTEP